MARHPRRKLQQQPPASISDGRTRLDSLPVELWHMIISSLPLRDRVSLSQSSRACYVATSERLYEDLSWQIGPAHEQSATAPGAVRLVQCLRSIIARPRLGHGIRTVHIQFQGTGSQHYTAAVQLLDKSELGVDVLRSAREKLTTAAGRALRSRSNRPLSRNATSACVTLLVLYAPYLRGLKISDDQDFHGVSAASTLDALLSVKLSGGPMDTVCLDQLTELALDLGDMQGLLPKLQPTIYFYLDTLTSLSLGIGYPAQLDWLKGSLPRPLIKLKHLSLQQAQADHVIELLQYTPRLTTLGIGLRVDQEFGLQQQRQMPIDLDGLGTAISRLGATLAALTLSFSVHKAICPTLRLQGTLSAVASLPHLEELEISIGYTFSSNTTFEDLVGPAVSHLTLTDDFDWRRCIGSRGPATFDAVTTYLRTWLAGKSVKRPQLKAIMIQSDQWGTRHPGFVSYRNIGASACLILTSRRCFDDDGKVIVIIRDP